MNTLEYKKLGDIFKATRGSTPEKVKDGSIPWITISDMNNRYVSNYTRLVNKEKNLKIYPEGSLLISFKMSIGKVGFLKNPSAINEAILAIKPDECSENLNFLYFFLPKLFQKHATRNGQGIPLLNQATIEKITIPLPNINQQKSIASILSTQESVINEMEELIELYEKRLRYTSNELLSGRLRVKEIDGETAFYKNEKWKLFKVNGKNVEIPEDWDIKKIDFFCRILDSIRKPLNSIERSQMKGNIPYWGANSIVDNINKYLIDDEVVLLGEDAAPFFDKNKKVAFISKGKIWANNHVHILKSDKNICSLDNLQYQLNKLDYLKIIGVANRPKLTQSMMRNIEILLPTIMEQNLIAHILIQQEDLIQEQKELLELEKKRFNWLLENLLSGKYIVEDSADDNEQTLIENSN